MKEYRYIKSALSEFSTDYSVEESTDSFKLMIKNSPKYALKLKEEISIAVSDDDWSWASAANEVDFVGAGDTDEGVWETVKVLIWEIVAPGEEAPTPSPN